MTAKINQKMAHLEPAQVLNNTRAFIPLSQSVDTIRQLFRANLNSNYDEVRLFLDSSMEILGINFKILPGGSSCFRIGLHAPDEGIILYLGNNFGDKNLSAQDLDLTKEQNVNSKTQMKFEFSPHFLADFKRAERIMYGLVNYFAGDRYVPTGYHVHVAYDFHLDRFPKQLNFKRLRTRLGKKEIIAKPSLIDDSTQNVEYHTYQIQSMTIGKANTLQVQLYNKTEEMNSQLRRQDVNLKKISYLKQMHESASKFSPGRPIFRLEVRMPSSYLQTKQHYSKEAFKDTDFFQLFASNALHNSVRFFFKESKVNIYAPLWTRIIEMTGHNLVQNPEFTPKTVKNQGQKKDEWTEFSTYLAYKIRFSKRERLTTEQFIDEFFLEGRLSREGEELKRLRFAEVDSDLVIEEMYFYLANRYNSKDIC